MTISSALPALPALPAPPAAPALPDLQLSPAARLQSAFPLTRDPRLAPFAAPGSLDIPLSDIDAPDRLPRFLLLGERDDASFQCTEEGFAAEYVWPDMVEGPVCRLSSSGRRLNLEEFWAGQSLGETFFHGDTLAQALLYHYRAVLALRDCRRWRPGGPSMLHHIDRRELFFREWFREHLDITWHLPVYGVRHSIDLPGGIQRALVVPCLDEEQGLLTRLANAYRSQEDAYAIDGRPGRVRHGRFSRRRCLVQSQLVRRSSHGLVFDDEIHCRLFIGGWRAVVDLARFLGDNGWDYINGYRLPASVCFPHQLVRPFLQHLEVGEHAVDVLYPPLLPPQEAFGVTEGLVPAPLGELEPFRSGGPENLLRSLREAVDEAYPDGAELSLHPLPEHQEPPPSWMRRTSDLTEPTTPVLCVLCRQGARDLDAFAEILQSAGRGQFPLAHRAHGAGQLIVTAPNLAPRTYCHDPEGFYHLLPDVVRRIEEELETAWLVEDFVLDGTHDGRQLEVHQSAGPRSQGW